MDNSNVCMMSGHRLIRTRRGWVEPGPPEYCGYGHPLGPGTYQVGSQACGCGTIHRVFHCDVCADRMYRPEPGPGCSFVNFDGRSAEK